MFRKLINIIVSLLLLTTTVGFSISKHYCGEDLISISISHEAESCCDMEGENGCCHNETEAYQLNNIFVISPVLDNSSVNHIDLLFSLFYITIEDISLVEGNSIYQIPESPPPINLHTVLSKLQSFLC